MEPETVNIADVLSGRITATEALRRAGITFEVSDGTPPLTADELREKLIALCEAKVEGHNDAAERHAGLQPETDAEVRVYRRGYARGAAFAYGLIASILTDRGDVLRTLITDSTALSRAKTLTLRSLKKK